MPTVYFLDVPEYRPFIDCLDMREAVQRTDGNGYVAFSSETPLEVSRDETGLGEAVWFGALVSGFDGTIDRFDSEVLRIR